MFAKCFRSSVRLLWQLILDLQKLTAKRSHINFAGEKLLFLFSLEELHLTLLPVKKPELFSHALA